MSIRVLRQSISDEQAIKIAKLLTIREKIVPNKFNKFSVPKEIKFYRKRKDFVELPYSFARMFFPEAELPNDCCKIDIEFKGTLREEQKSVIKEANDSINEFGTAIICTGTGSGKTVMGSKLIADVGLKACVISPLEVLLDAWKESLMKFTTAKVGIVGQDPIDDCDVLICMDQRYKKIPNIDEIGMLLLDEADMLCTPSRRECLLSFHPRVVVVETATPERDDQLSDMIVALVGPENITREANKSYEVFKYNTEISNFGVGVSDWKLFLEHLYNNEERNEIILNIVKNNLSRKMMIITDRIVHVKILVKMIQDEKIGVDYLYGKKSKFNDSNVLVGIDKKMSVGLDTSSAIGWDNRHFDFLLIVCYIKRFRQLVQAVGRVTRAENSRVVYLVDSHFKSKEVWEKAKKILSTQKCVIYE